MSSNDLKEFNEKVQLRKIRREGLELIAKNEGENNEKKKLTSAQKKEIKEFQSIGAKYDAFRLNAERLYHSEYKTRVEVERRELIDKAGSKVMEHTPRHAMFDKFNKHDLTRQAQLNVRSQHNQLTAQIDTQELKESKSFLEKSSRRKEYREAFTKSAERRRSETRRQSPERRIQTQTMSD